MLGESIGVEVYKDQYGERLALKYRYNPDTNQMLKDKLGFPKFKWDRDIKAWSIQNKKSVVDEAIAVLRIIGAYDIQSLLAHSNGLPKDEGRSGDCWTKMKRSRLYLHWPYLSDNNLRETVRLAVRSISGRKFHSDDKCWSIPSAQARTLYGLLEDSYPPLAKAIIDNKDVEKDVAESINRVEISSASELPLQKLTEIDEKLKGKFPEGLQLYPFQKVAVAFAEMSKGRCLIGDEMGIGKTISAIGYAAINPQARPAIVVCPSNVKFNWKKEVNKWLPDETVQVITSGKDEPELGDFIIVNYDLMTKMQEKLIKLVPRLVILDECHYIKNSGSKNKPVKRTVATLALCRFTPKILALSGTAIASRPKEFFNTLNLMRPEQFASFWDFAQRYCDPWHDGFGWNFDGASYLKN